jgi:transcriptional regulator with XRE-family HTH domain
MNEFKNLREQSGMNMKRFAEYFGIPYRTVQNWEAGVNKCPEYLLNLMEFKLNVDKRKGDFLRLYTYMMDHEDTDTALMYNAGLDTFPSTIFEEFKK